MPKRFIVIALIVGVIVAACGNRPAARTDSANGELPGTNDSAGEPSSEVDGPSTEPGEADAGMDNTSLPLPNGFPEGFPLPEGAIVVADFSMPQEENNYQVYFEVPGSFEESMAFFEAAFSDTGWEIQSTEDFSSGETQSFEIQIAGQGFEGRVLILSSGEGLGLEVSLGPSS